MAVNKKQKELEELMTRMPPTPQLMMEMQKTMKQQRDLAAHLEEDALPLFLGNQVAGVNAQPPQMQNQPAVPNPEGSNVPRVPQMQGGEMNGMQNNPQMAQPAGLPGRPPMAAQVQ